MRYNIGKELLLLVAMIAMLALPGCGSKAKIDLTEYVHVDISGASDYGYAHAYIDGTMLDAIAFDAVREDESALDRMERIQLLSQIECKLDKTEKLTNGDVVTVTITYPDTLEEALDADITPRSGESWTVEVKNLEVLHEYDVFGDVSVSFEGWNGYGKAVIELSGGCQLRCTASQTEGLSNGDVITVTLEAPNGADLIDYCISEEFLPAVETKEYTVSKLKEAPRIDLFEEIDIVPVGRSPFLSLTIRGKYGDVEIG